ncbi:MAG: hypothetical protein SGJ27_01040 [Candidatus Melainabacteria bacterium]|nr:hypothetical protein [Candidatus Melainabacteria bacterium]
MNEDQKPQSNPPAPRHRFPYSTTLYSMTQMASVILTVSMILPAVLHVSFTGTLIEEAIFFILFSIGITLVGYAFLALAGYFAIMVLVAQNLRKLTMADTRSKDVAKALAIRVLLSNQPRWLISLTPCVVPAATLAIMAQFYKDKLAFENNDVLLQACLIQALVSFLMCLPFILKTQRMFNTNVLEEKHEPVPQSDD